MRCARMEEVGAGVGWLLRASGGWPCESSYSGRVSWRRDGGEVGQVWGRRGGWGIGLEGSGWTVRRGSGQGVDWEGARISGGEGSCGMRVSGSTGVGD